MTSEEAIELTDKNRKNKNLFLGIKRAIKNLLPCLISCFYQNKGVSTTF